MKKNPWVTLIILLLTAATVTGWVLFFNKADDHNQLRVQWTKCSNARYKAEKDVRTLQDEILYETGRESKQVPPCENRCAISNMEKSECSILGGRLPDGYSGGPCRLPHDEQGCIGIGGEWSRGEYPDC